jgi:cytosine/adenosine deaminase-related metal-dependent hydrolase
VTAYWCECAWLGSDRGLADSVVVTTNADRIAAVDVGREAPPDAVRLAGVTIPGLANCHSHAFHRALRGRTQRGSGSFWTWRDQMYAVADRLDPERYYRLARATYAEMALAGVTCVGEFHYLHHDAGGRPYDDANAFGHALIQAARDVGIRIALLDTCYLAAGFGREPEGVQRRFSDGDADRWADRIDALAAAYAGAATAGASGAAAAAAVAGADGAYSGAGATDAHAADVLVGAAIHSVRAVPADQIGVVAAWAGRRRAPLHVHLSEQPAENTDCLAATRMTPTALLEEHGALGPTTSAVHATHLTDGDVAQLGSAGAYTCFCPTTERDLADGIGRSTALRRAGATLTLGSDSHAIVDPFEEMRALELDERLASRQRGSWSASELLQAATVDGHRSLGFEDAGTIAAGARADLVAVATDTVRTGGAGGGVDGVVFAATAGDVTDVVSGGTHVVVGGAHRSLPAVAGELAATIDGLWEDA